MSTPRRRRGATPKEVGWFAFLAPQLGTLFFVFLALLNFYEGRTWQAAAIGALAPVHAVMAFRQAQRTGSESSRGESASGEPGRPSTRRD